MAANRGDNNGRTLIGMAKRWPLNRGLSFHTVLRLFRDFYNWLLNRGWLLNRWPLNGDSTDCSLHNVPFNPVEGWFSLATESEL